MTLVDLRTFAVHQIQVTVAPDTSGNIAETQVYLAGRPLQLVVTTGGTFQTRPVADIVAGRTPAVTSTAPVGVGTHGPVVSRDGDRVFSTTVDGFDGASISGATLGSTRSVAYSATRNVVQNYRPGLAADGRTVWGAVTEDTGLTPAQWTDTRNNVNTIDTTTFRSSLIRLPDGVTYLPPDRRHRGPTRTHRWSSRRNPDREDPRSLRRPQPERVDRLRQQRW